MTARNTPIDGLRAVTDRPYKTPRKRIRAWYRKRVTSEIHRDTMYFGVSTDELTSDDFRALAEFRYQIRAFLHFSEDAARAEGLSPQQHQLLLALKGLPEDVEPTVRTIAERLHLRHHSAVELTDRLAACGMIRKRRNPKDHRSVLLIITARGEAVLRRLSVTHRAQLQSYGKDLIRSVHKILKENEGTHEKRSR